MFVDLTAVITAMIIKRLVYPNILKLHRLAPKVILLRHINRSLCSSPLPTCTSCQTFSFGARKHFPYYNGEKHTTCMLNKCLIYVPTCDGLPGCVGSDFLSQSQDVRIDTGLLYAVSGSKGSTGRLGGAPLPYPITPIVIETTRITGTWIIIIHF